METVPKRPVLPNTVAAPPLVVTLAPMARPKEVPVPFEVPVRLIAPVLIRGEPTGR
jgi:hypothetical protein